MTETSWTHTHTFTLPAAPPAVFQALIDARALQQWFAEHVVIEPRPGGMFRFWGRHTYGVPAEADATGVVTRVEPDRTLSFDWTFEGVPSRVTLEVQPHPKGDAAQSQLVLTHQFDRRLGVAWDEELVDDLWRLTMGNLAAHLRGGDGIVRPDYSDPAPHIRMSILIDAPKERVYRALIEPDALAKWLGMPGGTTPIVEPRVGGRYEYGWVYEIKGRPVIGGPTKILELVENERVVTDWLDWRGDATRPPTRLVWTLESVGQQTRVTLIHDGFSRTADMSDYPFGWMWFLQQLKKVAEGSL